MFAILKSFPTSNFLIVPFISLEVNSTSKPNLLDDDAPLSLTKQQIDLSNNYQETAAASAQQGTRVPGDVLNFFDGVVKTDDLDDEFAQLAAESLLKKRPSDALPINGVESDSLKDVKEPWSAFEET